jgi:hypothetical protein
MLKSLGNLPGGKFRNKILEETSKIAARVRHFSALLSRTKLKDNL